MDGQWNFRNAYNEARKVKDVQDAFCQKVEANEWSPLDDQGKFPESLQWEALVDVLRGRVKVSSKFLSLYDLPVDVPSSPSTATRFVSYMTHQSR